MGSLVGMNIPGATTNPGGEGQTSAPTSGNGLADNWWVGTQFDQGGKFAAPSFTGSMSTPSWAHDQVAQGNAPGGIAQQMMTYSPVNRNDPVYQAYGQGGRAGDMFNGQTAGFELNSAMRQSTGLNNGRVYLQYSLDPSTGQYIASPNGAALGEAEQNKSLGVGLAQGAKFVIPRAAAMIAGAYGANAAMGGGAGTGAASTDVGYMGPGSAGAGATGEGATAPTLMQNAQTAYNTYNRVNQGVNVARNLTGGNTRGASSGLGSMIGGYFGGSLGSMAGGMAGGALGGTVGNSNGGNVQGNIGGSGPGDTVSTGDQNFNWGNLAGGVVGGLAGAINTAGDRNYSQDLRNAWENNQNANAPYIQQLQQSYSDPNSYLKGPEFTAINDLYNNQITRQAAAGGRLGNDTDRQVLLQKFAMQSLGNYRSGLENTISNNQRNNLGYLPNYSAGLAGRAGAQGSVLNGAIQGAGGASAIGSGIKSVWDQLFGSGGSGTTGGSVPVGQSPYAGGGDYSGYTTGGDTSPAPTIDAGNGNWWDNTSDTGNWYG